MTHFDVVGFGALNVDKLFKVNRIAHGEEESFIVAHETACGGSAANTMVGLARLDCKVGFVGKAGLDGEGELLIEDFLREGVDTRGIIRAEKGESGTVLGFVDEHGQRALYINSGVNDSIEPSDVDNTYLNTQFLHLTSFVGDQSFQAQKQILESCPRCLKITLDPGALYARRGFAQLAPIIERSYALMPNLSELLLMTGEKDPEKAADFLMGKGVEVVAVKLGGKGCYVTNGYEKHYVEAFKVSVVDTTGAGDAFNAGFLYGLLDKKSLLECAKIGNFVASRKLTKMGARTALPYLKDLKLPG
jgi:ribokinase